ncbi:tyrosine-type recombinase/integrase [Robiginitalea sediminis]|uniref:tyrosine-type recombinase/integrase n=1 Tax=Robiginitalea sediminis TaxID=1982593 RepID=UPI0013037080|nr:tyrosine-type recombinase/integrase [Robiginitalea sediminis]
MKKLRLQNESYRVLVSSFRDWLDVLGYAESTVYYLPNHLQEFFYAMEQAGITGIGQITSKTIRAYYEQLQQRANERRAGALSKAYLNKHQQALKKFREYLRQHGVQSALQVHLKAERDPGQARSHVLTQAEIKRLFKATRSSHPKSQYRKRDRAILVLLYSAGLRRNEAVSLDVSDILFDRQRIYVRKGKNYKERFVPVNAYNLDILQDYLYASRPRFNIKCDTEAFLLNHHGTRLLGMSLAHRLQAMVQAANDPEISEKQITLHTLRHSIATHLLEQEVPLEKIKTFLGHSSLESTQIYTHLLEKMEDGL